MEGKVTRLSLPVYGGLPKSIIEAIEEVEEHRPDIAMVSPISWDEGGVRDGGTGIGLLVGIATSPDDHGEDEKRDPRNLGSKATANTLDVEKVTQDGSGNDLGKVVQETVQGLGASGEVGAVDTVLLVGVEPVRRPEHGEQEDDKGLEADSLPQTDELRLPAGILHEDDARAIRSNDVRRVAEHKGENCAEQHEDDEGNISPITHGLVGGHVDVLAKRNLRNCLLAKTRAAPMEERAYQTANDGPHVEDAPEPGEVSTLLALGRVRDHDGALSGPQETGANTEQGAREDFEAGDIEVHREEQREGVDAVSNSTKSQGVLNANSVDEGSTKETEDRKGGVQRSVLRGKC